MSNSTHTHTCSRSKRHIQKEKKNFMTNSMNRNCLNYELNWCGLKLQMLFMRFEMCDDASICLRINGHRLSFDCITINFIRCEDLLSFNRLHKECNDVRTMDEFGQSFYWRYYLIDTDLQYVVDVFVGKWFFFSFDLEHFSPFALYNLVNFTRKTNWFRQRNFSPFVLLF